MGVELRKSMHVDQNRIKEVFGEDSSLGFYQHSRMRYSDQELLGASDELMIGVYHEGGGTSGEFKIELLALGHKFSPRLCMFSDSWQLFPFLSPILERFASRAEDLTFQDIIQILLDVGVKDLSDRPLESGS